MSLHEQDTIFMAEALQLARQADEHGEVPVGAVVIRGNKIIGRGWNQPITAVDPSAHAEIVALRQAAAQAQNYRLPETTLYVTLEPCIMCAGAIIHARVKRLVFGAPDPKTGAAGSVFDVFASGKVNHVVDVEGGLMADACGDVLRCFFRSRR
jgi:tRNA(adenine34) deaminase